MTLGSDRRASSPRIDGYIRRWRPRTLEGAGADLVRRIVAGADPASINRAKTLLWTGTQVVLFARRVGLEEKPEVLFHPSTIERLVRWAERHMSAPAIRTLRTNLRHLAVSVVPEMYPASAPLSREKAKQPYSAAEIGAYLALADAQPTPERAMRASALVCLAAGCGIVGRELAYVRGTHVVCRSGGVVVQVSGRRARAVPVLAQYQDRLLASAEWAGQRFLIGGVDPNRRTVTTQLVSSLSGGVDLPRLDTGRLRSSWLAEVAGLIGLPTFMAAAGIVCSQRLGDIIASLRPADETQAVRLLGAIR